MRVAIVGDGIAAHLAAAMLARAGLDVVRVPVGRDDDGLGPIGESVLGLPDWQATDIAAAIGWLAGSAFTLGVAFAGWGKDDWFWPFGDLGAPVDAIPFPQVAARVRLAGKSLRLADFALAGQAAPAERFAPPAADPRSPLATLAVGIAYPAASLRERLARLAADAGVRVLAPLADAATLALVDGSTPAADLYIDAAGGAISPEPWEDWRGWLPCDRVVSRRVTTDRTPPPYPLHAAGPAGWQAHVALDGALVETDYAIGGVGTPYRNGVRPAAWSGNRVAIGAAAGIVEPVLGTPLLLAQAAVARLLDLLPHDPADTRAEADEYNRLTRLAHEQARDAAVALWATNTRYGAPAWDAARDAAPPGLAHKLALYRSRGHLPMQDDEPLSRSDWIALLDGQGVRQRRLDPRAAALPADAALAHCARIHDRFAAAVRTMPPHADALRRLRNRR